MEYSPSVVPLFGVKSGGRSAPASTPDVLLRSFIHEPPEHLKPTTESSRLAVALVWGSDHLLDLKELNPGEKLTIGADPSATMQVFHEVTRTGHVLLVQPQPDGSHVFFVPAGATARLRLNGEELSVVELLERGLATPVHAPVEGVACALNIDDRAELRFGNVRLIARYLRPAFLKRPSPFGPLFWSRVAIYLLTALTAYQMASMTDFEDMARQRFDPVMEELGPGH
jgi:hypothetical protein